MTAASVARPRTPLYYRLWRWHFFAGLFCVPFIVLLSITGSIYLFKPQINSLLEARYDSLQVSGTPLAPEALVGAAVAAVPGSRPGAFFLPTEPDTAVRIQLETPDGRTLVYLHPDTGAVLGSVRESERFMEVVKTIHGELLAGDTGSLLVELAASWAIVMVATGLYLWWPRGAGLAGVLRVRTGQGRRLFWRDLHAVTGVWVSGAALVLLLTGLPWTNVWGDGFKAVREITGTAAVRQDWSRSRTAEAAEAATTGHEDHAGHDHAGHGAATDSLAGWNAAVAQARALDFAPPVRIQPPSDRTPVYRVISDTQNRPLRATAELDPATAAVLGVERFGDRHPVDRVVGYGIALHEGALFGLANQLLGLATALGLILLSVSSVTMWWARRPKGRLGAPPFPADHRLGPGFVALGLVFCLFLPVLGVSVVVIAVLDRLVWPLARRVLVPA